MVNAPKHPALARADAGVAARAGAAVLLLSLAFACGGPRPAGAPDSRHASDASDATGGMARDLRSGLATGRPRDPWVVRSVLDGNARMLTAALHPELWLAVDVERGELWRVFGGGVEFTGTVYDTLHGPQPTSQPPIHLGWTDWRAPGPGIQPDAPGEGWRMHTGEPARVRWRGHRFLPAGADGRHPVRLEWDLVREGRAPVEIHLHPEARVDAAGLVLQLSVDVVGLGEGEVVLWDLPPAQASLRSARSSGGVRPMGSLDQPTGLAISSSGRLELLFVNTPSQP